MVRGDRTLPGGPAPRLAALAPAPRSGARTFYILTLSLLALAVGVQAQDINPENEWPAELALVQVVNMDREVAQSLAQAEANLAKKDYDKVLESLQTVLALDKMVFTRLPSDPRRYVSPRTVANEVLAGLPQQALELYEKLQGPKAERLFQEGKQKQDEALLARVASEFFHTRAGGQAADLLGMLRFDRGAFFEAAHIWEQAYLTQHTAPLDRPLLLTKSAVGWYLGGDVERSRQLLAKLKAEHAGAESRIQGQPTRLAEFLEKALAGAADTRGGPGEVRKDWPSLAGTPNAALPMQDASLAGVPVWFYPASPEQRLKRVYALAGRKREGAAQPPGSLSWVEAAFEDGRPVVSVVRTGRPTAVLTLPVMVHPVIFGGLVFQRDDREITAHNPSDGRVLWRCTALPMYESCTGLLRTDNTYRPFAGDMGRYALTAGGDKLYAVGRFRPADHYGVLAGSVPPIEDGSVLAALQLGAGEQEGKVAWEVGRGKGDSDVIRQGKFLTAPTYENGRLYALLKSLEVYHAVCLDAQTGATLWTTLVGPLPVSAYRNDAWQFVFTLEVLTERGSPAAVAGGRVYMTTNAGLVLAVDAESGRPAWGFQYPSPIGLRVPSITDRTIGFTGMSHPLYPQNPPVAARGRTFVLPADSETLYALEAETGRPLWETPRRAQQDLSALPGERLLLSGPDFIVLDARDGKVLKEVSAGDVVGRPAVTPQAVLVSGKGRLLRLDLEKYALTPTPVADKQATLGRLFTAGGLLLSANGGGLTAFLPAGAGAESFARQLEATKDPSERAEIHLRRVEMALGAGRLAEAEQDLRAADREIARAADAKLKAEFRPRMYRVCLRMLGLTKDDAQMGGLLDLAQAHAPAPSAQAEVALWRMRREEQFGRPEKALAAAQALSETLPAAELPEGAAPAEAARSDVQFPSYGYAVGQRHVARLIQAHGQGVYAAYDAQAQQALEAGQARGEAAALLAAHQRYPHSTHAAELLLAAAQALYARATRASPPPKDLLCRAARVLAELRNYPEAQKGTRLAQTLLSSQLEPALLTVLYPELRQADPQSAAGFAGDKRTVGDMLKSHLAALLPDAAPVEPAACVSGPLREVYTVTGKPCALLRDRRGRAVRLGERVLLKTPAGLVCLDTHGDDLARGTVWTAPCPAGLLSAASLGHVAAELGSFFICDRQTLAAFDAATGQMRWQKQLQDWNVAGWSDAQAEGRWLVIAGPQARHAGVDLSKGEVVWQSPPSSNAGVRSLQLAAGVLLSRDARSLGGGCFDVRSGALLRLVQSDHRTRDFVLNPDGLAVYLSTDKVELYDLWQRGGPAVWQRALKSERVALRAVGRRYFAVSEAEGPGSFEVWDCADPARTIHPAFEGAVAEAGFSGDRLLVLGAAVNASPPGQAPKLLKPFLAACELPSGKLLWRREVASAQDGYCRVSPVRRCGDCLSVTVGTGYWQTARGVVVSVVTGEAVECPPLRLPEALGGVRDVPAPEVFNGRVLLESEDALVVLRSPL